MDSCEIERFLRQRLTYCDAIFSVETLPAQTHLLVCNADSLYRPGRHLVCIFVEDGQREYLDSFGCRPNAVFNDILNRHCSSWTYSDRLLTMCLFMNLFVKK